MPLARGTAAVGYLTILGMLLAAECPVSHTIPAGVQASDLPIRTQAESSSTPLLLFLLLASVSSANI